MHVSIIIDEASISYLVLEIAYMEQFGGKTHSTTMAGEKKKLSLVKNNQCILCHTTLKKKERERKKVNK